MTQEPSRPFEWRLFVYVALGTAVGAAYVVFDVLSEARLESGTLTGTLASTHAVVDHVFPVLVGALLGVGWHYLGLRARLVAAEEAAARAEALRVRLQRVERDQAVWVLVAAVLHELNNPLHALGLLLDELGDGRGSEPDRVALVERARSQVDRALSHLQTLRSMGVSGEADCQRVSLDRIVAEVADDARALAAVDGLQVRVVCDAPIFASADPTYVRTIIENLVDNGLHALRSSNGAGTATGIANGAGTAAANGGSTANRGRAVTIRFESKPGRSIVCVTDDGPELGAEVRATLFEPLRTTKTHGLGLGLPIARGLARAMRGEVSFDDRDGKSFRLELPEARPAGERGTHA